MKKLLQIIYISRSTFTATDAVNKIEPNVARILAKSRLNNRKNGLVGVLYFGDGAFFQCLEGDETAVNTLLSKLELDPRHKDLKIISKKYITQLSFPDWAMKFAPLDESIKKFLKENQFEIFDPYLFSGEIINKFLGQLFNVADPTLDSSANIREQPEHIEAHKINASNAANTKSNYALGISIVAFLLSLLSSLSTHHLI